MGRKTIAIVAGLGVPALTVGTDFSGALMLVLPIEREFAADITTTQWVLNIYALTFAIGVSLPTAERLTLNGEAPGAAATRDILARFDTPVADRIIGVIRDAFVYGLNQSYWLCLALAIIGIFVALSLDEEKLSAGDA